MRIVLVGGNGQVGAEVALLLSRQSGVDVQTISRSREGSAFLRLNGIQVTHGDISKPEDARRILDGGDVIANFALALGSPASAVARNKTIIQNCFDYSPQHSTVVFFSTLAVHGEYSPDGRRQSTFYGRLKRQNEAQMQKLSRQKKHNAYVLRLGHVMGDYQRLNELIRDEISNPPVFLPYPDRLSNVTATVTIADALLAIASKRAGPPGIYDLLNQPQWNWREVYECEAKRQNIEVQFGAPNSAAGETAGIVNVIRNRAIRILSAPNLRQTVLNLSSRLPDKLFASIKAEYSVAATRADIAQLTAPAKATNSVHHWPSLESKNLPGLKETRQLIERESLALSDV
jgi:nucleoside-diphosphate-sugar epimerase